MMAPPPAGVTLVASVAVEASAGFLRNTNRLIFAVVAASVLSIGRSGTVAAADIVSGQDGNYRYTESVDSPRAMAGHPRACAGVGSPKASRNHVMTAG